jgi:hypothetical protein
MRFLPRRSASLPALLAGVLGSLAFRAGALPDSPAPGTANGTFSIDGKSVEVHYAYALSQPNAFDEKKSDTAILLTEKPLSEKELEGAGDLEKAGRGTKRNSVLFVLDEGGRPIREVVHHDALGDDSLQMSGMTHSDFQSEYQGKDRIQGTIRTKGSEEFLKHKYATDLRFNAFLRVARREPPPPDAKTGRKLPAGGGEPAKAYLALHDAVQKGDLAAVKKLNAAEVPPGMTDEELKKGLELMALMSPKKITITEGYVSGDSAVLYITGVVETEKQYGTVRLARSGGAWRVTQENWSNQPPSK